MLISTSGTIEYEGQKTKEEHGYEDMSMMKMKRRKRLITKMMKTKRRKRLITNMMKTKRRKRIIRGISMRKDGKSEQICPSYEHCRQGPRHVRVHHPQPIPGLL
jgi:hypothetical protein